MDGASPPARPPQRPVRTPHHEHLRSSPPRPPRRSARSTIRRSTRARGLTTCSGRSIRNSTPTDRERRVPERPPGGRRGGAAAIDFPDVVTALDGLTASQAQKVKEVYVEFEKRTRLREDLFGMGRSGRRADLTPDQQARLQALLRGTPAEPIPLEVMAELRAHPPDIAACLAADLERRAMPGPRCTGTRPTPSSCFPPARRRRPGSGLRTCGAVPSCRAARARAGRSRRARGSASRRGGAGAPTCR